MSIANDLNDVIEASGDMLGRLAIFADHIPDEWIAAVAALSERPLSAGVAYLLIWSCGSSWG
jgi:hypothetical protein